MKTSRKVLIGICGFFFIAGILVSATNKGNPGESLPPTILFGIVTLILILKKPSEKTKRKKVNIEELLAEKNFNISKKQKMNYLDLYIDDINKKFAITGKYNISHILKYSDIIDYDIKDNEKQTVSSGRTGATVGALAFGTAGAVIGASGKKEINSQWTSALLTIYLNNLDVTTIPIVFSNIFEAKSTIGLLKYMMQNK